MKNKMENQILMQYHYMNKNHKNLLKLLKIEQIPNKNNLKKNLMKDNKKEVVYATSFLFYIYNSNSGHSTQLRAVLYLEFESPRPIPIHLPNTPYILLPVA